MELIVSKGTVFGLDYHVIKPTWDISEYRFGGHNPHWDSMIAWTIDKFGPTPKDGVWTAGARWYVNNARFYFQEQKDLLVFILRWS